jgi:hypothetical protein
VSSRDLSLIDLFVTPNDGIEDFARDVAFEAANGFKLGMAVSYTSCNIFPRFWVQSQPSNFDDVKCAVSCSVTPSVQSVSCGFA